MATQIRPTRDSFGNRVVARTVLEAVRTTMDPDNTKTLKDMMEAGIVKNVDVLIINSGWTQSSISGTTFFKEFYVEDIRAIDEPVYSLKPAGNIATDNEIESFDQIALLETLDGSIKVYVSELPTTNITITLNSIPNRSY